MTGAVVVLTVEVMCWVLRKKDTRKRRLHEDDRLDGRVRGQGRIQPRRINISCIDFHRLDAQAD